VNTFTARRIEGALQLSQRFTKATTALWRYTWRNVRIAEGTLKIDPLLIPQLLQPARIGMISTNVVRDRRDNPTDAHRGIYNTLDLGVASHLLGGNKNFARLLARNSYYKTLRRFYVLATNTQFGWISPFRVRSDIDPTQYVPIAERFFGGGNSSHRGFPDNQAGPRDLLTGFPLGGNALLFHSTELRFPLLGDNINGVLFHDMGNIYSSPSDISFRVSQRDLTDFNYMVHAVGFGIRYRTPVGPVRIDLAYSLNPPRYNGLEGTYEELLFGGATPAIKSVKRFQFFISIGQAF
jgi:outer membrane protein assembly factor BamA